MTYEEAKRIRRTIRNPWLTVALDRVAQFCERGMFQVEFTQTVLEFHHARDYHKPFRCECRGEVHWRPSSGGYKCVGCSKLYRANREPLPRPQTRRIDLCEGHPPGPFDPMGETVYCDGTCA